MNKLVLYLFWPRTPSIWTTSSSYKQWRIAPIDQPLVIGYNVASTSTPFSSGWHNTFMLGDKPLPNDSHIRTWRNGLGGQVADSLGQALLLLEDMQHYASYRDMDVAIKLKWHTIVVKTLFSFFFFFFCSSVSPGLIFNLLLLFVTIPSCLIGLCPRKLA